MARRSRNRPIAGGQSTTAPSAWLMSWPLRAQKLVGLTAMTIMSRTLSALYSTPPNSSICSSVNPWNLEFLPTMAWNVMYGASFASPSVTPDAMVPRPAIELVRGIVIVLDIFIEAFGKNRSKPIRRISKGVGNPPKPESFVSGRCEMEGRTEYVRGKPAPDDVAMVGLRLTILSQPSSKGYKGVAKRACTYSRYS